jgi:zinc protease
MPRRWTLAAAAGVLAAAIVHAQPASFVASLSVPYTRFTLPNGLTVILQEDHRVPQIAINLAYHVGSARETPGHTGFAHLFEHLMFDGSAHVKKGEIDTLLNAAGGAAHAVTTEEETTYYEQVPSNALDLALFLESDRMQYLLDAMTPAVVDAEREIVKNELQQSYLDAPYGKAYLRITELLYPPSHPYHWPVVGYIDDLSAATYADVVTFFKTYYTPSNATLVIAGDIEPADARRRVEHWFSDVAARPRPGPLTFPPVALTSVTRETLTDRVGLPRIFLCWPTPARFAPGDAALDVLARVLADGKGSRLYKRLVYDEPLAQDVSASENPSPHGSIFLIDVTARPSSASPADVLARIVAAVDRELDTLRTTPPTADELERARSGIETTFVDGMQTIAGKAQQMNAYDTLTGHPDDFADDLGRYETLQPGDVQAALDRWLPRDRRVELSIVPEAK